MKKHNPAPKGEYVALANAQAFRDTDKLIFTPDGVFPNLIFNSGAVPTFDVRVK